MTHHRTYTRRRGCLLVSRVLLVPLCPPARGGELDPQEIAAYQTQLEALVNRAEAAATDPWVLTYLKTCQRCGQRLREIAASDLRGVELSKAVKSVVDERRAKQDELSDRSLADNEFAQEEQRLYDACPQLSKLMKDEYIRKVVLRRQLMELKYFEEDDPKSGNFLEAYINGKVPFLRYSEHDVWYRHHGVSSWEATFRTEPLILFNHDKDPGFLVAAGLLYNFFPEVRNHPTNLYETTIRANLPSQYLKRMGLRLGVGARFGDGTDFIVGGGVQVRVFTVWSVYDPDRSEFIWAVGISDWKWLGKVLPIFGKN